MNILTTDWAELGRWSPVRYLGATVLLYCTEKAWHELKGRRRTQFRYYNSHRSSWHCKVTSRSHLGMGFPSQLPAGAITSLYFHRKMLLKLVWPTWRVTAGFFWLQGIRLCVSHSCRGLIRSFPLKTAPNLTVSYCHIDIIFIVLHRVKFCFLPFAFWKYIFYIHEQIGVISILAQSFL